LLSGIPEGAKNNSTLWDILQGEIEECLDLALYNYIGAFKGKPLSKKSLAFTCRVLYDYMAKSGNTQCVSYWDRLNKNLKSMNEDPILARLYEVVNVSLKKHVTIFNYGLDSNYMRTYSLLQRFLINVGRSSCEISLEGLLKKNMVQIHHAFLGPKLVI
jgi:hypothetical protein